jgi:TRAP-type C4-dicarboxylate transport system permease small subunit
MYNRFTLSVLLNIRVKSVILKWEEDSKLNNITETEEEVLSEAFPETIFDRIIVNLGTFLFVIMLSMVWIQILIRYFASKVGFSLPWTEEISRYLFFTLTILGSVVAIRLNGHIRIITIYNMFKPKIKNVFDIISYILIIIFVIIGINGSWRMTNLMWNSPTGSITFLKMGYLYLLLAILLVMMGINAIRGLVFKTREFFQYNITIKERGN